MFNKLSPTPITNKTHRSLLIFTMIWFFSGAWIDSSAHTYLIDDIETFFTPWHGVLYSGYIFWYTLGNFLGCLDVFVKKILVIPRG